MSFLANFVLGTFLSWQMSPWSNVLLGKRLLGKCILGQMYLRANVLLANVHLSKCLSGQTSYIGKCLYGQMLSGQISPRANVVRANVSGQMSPGKCWLSKSHRTLSSYIYQIKMRQWYLLSVADT
jgi:hypothetical protein